MQTCYPIAGSLPRQNSCRCDDAGVKVYSPGAYGSATQPVLREWIGALGLTTKSGRNLLTPLRSVFEDALNNGLIKRYPFSELDLAKLFKQTAKNSEYEVVTASCLNSSV